jgi:hypothetical protein
MSPLWLVYWRIQMIFYIVIFMCDLCIDEFRW